MPLTIREIPRLLLTLSACWDPSSRGIKANLKDWACRLSKLESEGRKVVVWGAGAKAATFLNLLRPIAVDYVVDVNPRKQGKYVVGTGQQIVRPEFLLEYRPDEIILYEPELSR